ncbi:MAG TPA: 16S rRNA (guanine(966)-N(2))-methyltransferase RsmD [Blastocatellia bacterium]|nr:16S rRNA (guanine(966)-N(2))-methyltransferase RsmD [Blastocatellia bacterium]
MRTGLFYACSFSIIDRESRMRVIGGKYGGRRLRSAPGLAVRPTSDRLRETLFNILAPVIEGSRFLDICAGSGAVGIEALSRGAAEVTFIERSRRTCATIKQNLAALDAGSNVRVINREAVAALRRLASEPLEFEIAFFDPPYASGVYSEVMDLLGASGLIVRDGIVVVEHRAKTPPRTDYGALSCHRVVKQGESALAFYSKRDA